MDYGSPRTGPAGRRAACLALINGSLLVLAACGQTAGRLERPADGDPAAAPDAEPAQAPGTTDRAQKAPPADAEVVIRALALVGVPYTWGGSDPQTGLDCSGLVAHVYREAAGIALPRTSRQMSERGLRVSRSQLRPSDLVFFNTTWRSYSHVGIYVGDGQFIHAPSRGSLVRVDPLARDYWRARFVGARRLLSSEPRRS